MFIEHLGKVPVIDPAAFVTPNVVVCEVVHLKTCLAPGGTVPIGWAAVGDPAQMFPAGKQEAI